MSQTFPQALRLLSTAEFQRVWKQGKRLSGPAITITCCENSLGYPRLGVSISKKFIPSAVARNRLKRLCRESFRLRQAILGGRDFVFVAHKGLDAIPPNEQFLRLNALWDRFTTHLK